MMPTNRSRVGQLVKTGDRPERFLNLGDYMQGEEKMGCKERGMMPTNRSRVGQLVKTGDRPERFLNLGDYMQ